MKLKLTILASGLLALGGAAHATDLNYDYLEVGYTVVDFDDFQEDLKGIFIGGSFLLSDEVYVFAGYADGQTDSFTLFGERGRLAVSNYTLGLGYRLGLTRQSDVNFGAAFERAKVEGERGLAFLGSDSDNGYSLSLGVRHLVSPAFEIGANVTYVDISDDDTILTLGALWHISDMVAVGLDYFVGSDADGFEGRLRFKF